MNANEAIAKLDAINERDPETAHILAESVLYELAPPPVQEAFDRVVRRCDWWAYA